MNCENTYCIYESDCRCTLDSISIDSTGQCAECVLISVSSEELVKLKNRQLKYYEKIDLE